MFKKKRGIRLTYAQQGLIYFTCINARGRGDEVEEHVRDLCSKIAGAEADALYEVLTNEHKSVLSVSLEYYIPEKTLYRWRKEFYEKWGEL